MHRLSLWIVLVTLFGSGAVADPTKVLVKGGEVSLPPFFPAAGDHLFGVTCSPVRLTTRPAKAAGPPFIADPGPTAKPVAVACANQGDFLETQGFQVKVHFDSLQDLGEWNVECKALFIAHNDFKSQTCGPNGCFANCFKQDKCTTHPQFCNPGGAHCSWACNNVQPFQSQPSFPIQVFNTPPVGSFSFSPAAPACGTGMTFLAQGSDPEGIVQFVWRVVGRPPGSSTDFAVKSGPEATLAFNQAEDVGDWSVELDLVDSQRELVTLPAQTFTVKPGKPALTVQGPGSVDVLQPIDLDATLTGACSGGSTVQWTAKGPGGQAPAIPPGPHLHLETTEKQIGAWTFAATATNPQGVAGDPVSHAVTVENLPPKVKITATTPIGVGEPIAIDAAASDPDGGELTLVWDLLQSPVPSGVPPKESFATGAALKKIPTTPAHAGSWIFRLTATDNDAQTNSSLTEEIPVLVDALPLAQATSQVDTAGSHLVLSAAESSDPDTDAAHERLDGKEPDLSAGLVQHSWWLSEPPPEWQGGSASGSLDEIFGSQVEAHAETAKIDLTLLTQGAWEFGLEVKDGEGNTATTLHRVDLIEDTAPTAVVAPGPARYEVVAGVLQSDIVLDGAASYDADDGSEAGAGITAWEWKVLAAPSNCDVPKPAAAKTTTLFAAGTLLPPDCHGSWAVELTVTDDDDPPRQGSKGSWFLIGNCPGLVCIDHPRTQPNHQEVDFADKVDIEIACHLDSAIYGQGPFQSGLLLRLSIFHEDDPTTPVHYVDRDFNALDTGKGGLPVFHWDGRIQGGGRPKPGFYTVQLVLEDANLVATGKDVQPQAIRIATAEPTILPSSTVIESRERLEVKVAEVTFDYAVDGTATVDAMTLSIYAGAGGTPILTRDVPSPGKSGKISWDGRLADGTVVATGAYEADLVAYRQGATLGTSPRHKLSIVRADLDADTDRTGTVDDQADEEGEADWTAKRGAIYNVNLDADGKCQPGGLPAADALDFDGEGNPTAEDLLIGSAEDVEDITELVVRGLGAPLPAGVKVVLKAAEQEDAESIHLFARRAVGEKAIWGGVGSRTGGAPQPLEVDLSQYVDPASPSFTGVAGGDVKLGLEGLFFRYLTNDPRLAFDGEIDLTLEFRRDGKALFGDAVRLKVAPWLLLPNTRPSTALRAADWGEQNAAFRLESEAADGYVGLDVSKQLETVASDLAGTQWLQDHVETGYYERPGGPKTLATLRLPYHETQPAWPASHLLACNSAAFQFGHDFDDSDGSSNVSGSYGGNLELLPPTTGHPLGQIVLGDTASKRLRDFLDSQEMQPVVTLPTRWLGVGHVDEMVTFTESPGQVIVADPVDAWALLEEIPLAERASRVFFATGAPLAGKVTQASTAPNRLETGIDLTGTKWEYVRIHQSGDSQAAGQVAHIAKDGLGNGFLVVDQVWDTGSKIVPGDGAETTILSRIENGRLKVNPYPPPPAAWLRPPAAGDGFVLVEGSREWAWGMPAIVTVAEVLADTDMKQLNLQDVKTQLDAARQDLEDAAGGSLTFAPVPALFVGRSNGFTQGRSASAFHPGLANAQPVGGAIYFPRQFGPRSATGGDLFEEVTEKRPGLANAQFVDDWDVYHAKLGEVHCGSTTVREPFPFPWWNVP